MNDNDGDLPYLVRATVRAMVDQGRLIEAGWLSLCIMVFPDASRGQQEQMRDVFFAGAQHVFASVVGMLSDDSEEITESDLRRMDKVHEELNRFIEDFKKRHPGAVRETMQ